MRLELPSRVLIAALACAGAVLSTAACARPPCVERQPLWSLHGKTNTVYLLGSVHFLNPAEPLPSAVDTAYADAETLIMEIDMDDLDPLEMQRATLELGLLPDNQSLKELLGPAAYETVAVKARELGLDPALLDRFRPWLAAITLVQLHLVKLGLQATSGVEQRLTTRASGDGKPIEGLETPRQQLSMLASLPEAQQREFLLYSVEDAERATQDINALLTAWRRGDTEALADLLSEGFSSHPELYRPLTVERNRRWAPVIESLLDDEDDYLIVVGALHLVGKDSVIDLLERKGLKVTQH